jgi:hypothetical protein
MLLFRMQHEGPREATRGRGGEREPNQILLQEPAYVSSSNPKAKILQEGDEHTPTNSVEMIPTKLQMQQKRNKINWTSG